MATSTISNTIKDPAGNALSGISVSAQLIPAEAFRISDKSEIVGIMSTSSDGSGAWSLTLEQNSNIDPPNTYYQITEAYSSSLGGPKVWKVLVGGSDANLHDSLVTPVSSPADTLTVSNSALNTLDTKVVHLTGEETITGAKTFQSNTIFEDGIVTQSAALATVASTGFLYIPTCAGPPTGIPVPQTGTVALVYDSANNNLYIYDGGWVKQPGGAFA